MRCLGDWFLIGTILPLTIMVYLSLIPSALAACAGRMSVTLSILYFVVQQIALQPKSSQAKERFLYLPRQALNRHLSFSRVPDRIQRSTSFAAENCDDLVDHPAVSDIPQPDGTRKRCQLLTEVFSFFQSGWSILASEIRYNRVLDEKVLPPALFHYPRSIVIPLSPQRCRCG